MQSIDLILRNASQLVTCASGSRPQKGMKMAEVGLIRGGAVAVHGEKIVAAGETAAIEQQYTASAIIDAAGCTICPGFIDPHTHLVYAGNRLDEFELRIQGATYIDILKQGGGILSTVRATREATLDELVTAARARLDSMLALGTTTVEIKTGYGLDTETELKMLAVIEELANEHTVDIVPTFLGGHAIPPEYKGRENDYADLVIHDMLPKVERWYHESRFFAAQIPCFIDVFCEDGAFSLDNSRRILAAGKQRGMGVKVHADEFVNLGGVRAAIELGAISVDHLDHTSEDEIHLLAQSDTVGVLLPAVNFNLGSFHYANARHMIDSGTAVALSTDANPGSAPCLSMPMVMAITCRYQKLLPAEALIASTINAAVAIGMGDRIGSLEPGKQADLLILDTSDYRDLAYQFGANLVKTVIKRGKVVA